MLFWLTLVMWAHVYSRFRGHGSVSHKVYRISFHPTVRLNHNHQPCSPFSAGLAFVLSHLFKMLGVFVSVVLGVLVHPAVLLLFAPVLFRIVQKSFRQYTLARSHGCKSAQVKVSLKDPFIGFDFLYDIFFSKTPDQYLESTWETFGKLGPTYTVKRWTWETIYTCDPQNIKKMLASGFQDFDLPEIRVSTMSPMFGQGIFTMTGQPWAHTRHFLRRCFTKPKLAPLSRILEGHFQALLNHIPADKMEVDLQPLFFALTTDVATEFLMGHSSGVLDPHTPHEDAQRFLDDYRTCSEEVVRQMQLGPLRHFRINANAEIAKKRVFDFMDAFIAEALDRSASEHSEGNLISELIGMTRDKKAIRDQVLHVLLASRDTTAGLLSNLFFVLAKNPKIYAKLRSDVLGVVGDATPSMNQLKDMEYLKWCVNECKYEELPPQDD